MEPSPTVRRTRRQTIFGKLQTRASKVLQNSEFANSGRHENKRRLSRTIPSIIKRHSSASASSTGSIQYPEIAMWHDINRAINRPSSMSHPDQDGPHRMSLTRQIAFQVHFEDEQGMKKRKWCRRESRPCWGNVIVLIIMGLVFTGTFYWKKAEQRLDDKLFENWAKMEVKKVQELTNDTSVMNRTLQTLEMLRIKHYNKRGRIT